MESPNAQYDTISLVISDAARLRFSVVLGSVCPESGRMERVVYGTKSSTDMHTSRRLGDEVNLPTARLAYSNVWYTPRELTCPDIAVPLKSWVNILVRVAEWLISHKHLDKSHCPVQTGRKTTILNTRPSRPDGTPFRLYEKVGDLYVNKTGVQTYLATQYSIELIELAGLDPFDFRIYFEDRRTPDPQYPQRVMGDYA